MEVRGEQVICRDDSRYVAHPHMARLADGTILVVATSAPRRSTVLHPPLDPDFVNVSMRSQDEGRTWSEPVPVPSSQARGMECAGLTALPDGGVLLNQWQFRWYRGEARPRPGDEPLLADGDDLRAELAASRDLEDPEGGAAIRWARGGGTATVCRSEDAGRSWSAPVALDVAPFSGGYGMRGGVVLPGGEILLPLSDAPFYARVFAVRSRDSGRTWGPPEAVAGEEGRQFEEPAPHRGADGSLLLVLRENATRRLHAVRSSDGGLRWSAPVPIALPGYPADLVDLGGGRLVAVTGVRDTPAAIHLHRSADDGRTWAEDSLVVAGDLRTRDCGYPTAVRLGNGDLLVAYYRQDERGVTGLYGKRIDLGEPMPLAA